MSRGADWSRQDCRGRSFLKGKVHVCSALIDPWGDRVQGSNAVILRQLRAHLHNIGMKSMFSVYIASSSFSFFFFFFFTRVSVWVCARGVWLSMKQVCVRVFVCLDVCILECMSQCACVCVCVCVWGGL